MHAPEPLDNIPKYEDQGGLLARNQPTLHWVVEAANLISAVGSSLSEDLDLIKLDSNAWCHLKKFYLLENLCAEISINSSSPVKPQPSQSSKHFCPISLLPQDD